MCDMTHLYVWHDSFICVTWLIHMCDMTHSCVPWLIHMCDMTHSCVCHDSFQCVTRHDAFRCVTRLCIHKSDSIERKKERKNKDKDPPTARDSILFWNMQQMLLYSTCWYKSDSPVLNMTRFEYAANITAANVTTLLATLMFAHLFCYYFDSTCRYKRDVPVTWLFHIWNDNAFIQLAGPNWVSGYWTWLFWRVILLCIEKLLVVSTCRSKYHTLVLNGTRFICI